MTLPFAAVVGYSTARRALLCTLVDPTLRGVIVSGPVGTGKSALMRSFGAFVREHVDPDSPFIQVPLGVTDDRLIGGIDLDASLAAGAVRSHAGLLADAHLGYLFADDLPLLDEPSIAAIIRALETETSTTEREGVSRSTRSRFVLLGTTVPAERDVAIGVADRVAFLIGGEPLDDDATRLLMRRVHLQNEDAERLARDVAVGSRRAAEQVVTARAMHPVTTISREALAWIAEASRRMSIAGNRADVFAAKAARAHAALRGAREVGEEDLEFAMATVLAPRAQNVPHEQAGGDADGGDGHASEDEPDGGAPRDASRTAEDVARADGEDTAPAGESEPGGEESAAGGTGGESPMSEQTLDAVDFTIPLPPLADFFATRRSRASGHGGTMPQWQRGRHTRSLASQARGRRIAIGATLRAAAPHQRARGRDGDDRIVVRGADLRVKKFSQRSGTLFIFCVDASGSMAANRMREAKGAVAQLLQNAYVNRDTVALIAFRGGDAEVLLPPTSSVERAKRSLDVLPTGGGTPLASALMRAYTLVELARRRDVEQSIVVLLTDGRANVPMAENAAGMIMEVRRQHVRKELETIALAYRRSGIRSLVIDTRQSYGASSEAVRLAVMLGARHFFLPRLDAHELAEVVRAIR